MSQSVGSSKISVGCSAIAIGLVLGLNPVSMGASAQDATTTKPSLTDELLMSPTTEDRETVQPSTAMDRVSAARRRSKSWTRRRRT